MLGTNFIGNISGIYRAAPVSPPFDRTWYANNVDQVNIRPASDRSLLLCFGDEISFDAHLAVARLTRSLAGVRGILNLHPAYTSVLVDFDPRLRSHAQVEALVCERLASQGQEAAPESRHVEIPVRYGGEFGPDLGDVARHTGLSEERVVELHSAAQVQLDRGEVARLPAFGQGGLRAELVVIRRQPVVDQPDGFEGIGR